MRLTPLLFALIVSLSIPAGVMAVPSGGLALATVGEDDLDPPVEWSVASSSVSGSGADSTTELDTTSTTGVSAQEEPPESGEQ